jgi:hypothetical protein
MTEIQRQGDCSADHEGDAQIDDEDYHAHGRGVGCSMRPGLVGSKGGHDRCFLMVDFAEKLPITRNAALRLGGSPYH